MLRLRSSVDVEVLCILLDLKKIFIPIIGMRATRVATKHISEQKAGHVKDNMILEENTSTNKFLEIL